MLGFNSDLLVSLQNVLPLVLMGTAFLSLCLSLGVAFKMGFFSLCVMLLSIRPLLKQATTQENDIFLAAFWLASIAMLLRWMILPKRVYLLLSGLAIGIVLGTKYSGLAYWGAFGAMLVVAVLVEPKGARRLSALVLAFLIWVCSSCPVGLYYYVRNWAVHGTPLFPSGLEILGVEVFQKCSDVDFRGSTLMSHVLDPRMWVLLLRAFATHAGWATVLSLFAVPLLGVLGRLNRCHLILFLGATFSFLILLVNPFGAENVPGTLNALRAGYSPTRFGLPFLLAAFAALVCVVSKLLGARSPYENPFFWSVAFLVLGLGTTWFQNDNVALYVMLAAITPFMREIARWRSMREARYFLRELAQPVSLLLLCVVFSLSLFALLYLSFPRLEHWRLDKRQSLYRDQLLKHFPRTSLFGWYDENIAGRTVAVAGLRVYPFFGPTFTNDVISVDERWVRNLVKAGQRNVSAWLTKIPDYLVVGVNTGDPAQEDFRKFPAWERSVIAHYPRLFQRVFSDHVAHVYSVHIPTASSEQAVETQKGPVASYPFEGDARNMSGPAYHLEVHNARLVQGVRGQAYEFNGKDSFLCTVGAERLHLGSYSIAGWAKVDVFEQHDRIVDLGWNKNNSLFIYVSSANDGINMEVKNSYGQTMAVALPDFGQEWRFFCFSYDQLTGQLKKYVDGECVLPAKVVPGCSVSASCLYIGGRPLGNSLDGALDEIKIWPYALSDVDVRKEANMRGTP